MKKSILSSWSVLAMLAVMVCGLRLIMAVNCSISDWGCATATVSIGAASWTQGSCPPGSASSPNAEDIPVLRSRCDSVEGSAGAVAASIIITNDGTQCSAVVSAIIPGSVTIDPGQTGCKVISTNTGCGGKSFKIFCP